MSGATLPLRPRPGRDDEDRLGILGRHSLGGILELEAVGEHELVPLRGEGPERFILLSRGMGLDVTDRESEGVVDLLKAGVGARVPGGVGNGSGGNETDAETGGREGLGAADQ